MTNIIETLMEIFEGNHSLCSKIAQFDHIVRHIARLVKEKDVNNLEFLKVRTNAKFPNSWRQLSHLIATISKWTKTWCWNFSSERKIRTPFHCTFLTSGATFFPVDFFQVEIKRHCWQEIRVSHQISGIVGNLCQQKPRDTNNLPGREWNLPRNSSAPSRWRRVLGQHIKCWERRFASSSLPQVLWWGEQFVFCQVFTPPLGLFKCGNCNSIPRFFVSYFKWCHVEYYSRVRR